MDASSPRRAAWLIPAAFGLVLLALVAALAASALLYRRTVRTEREAAALRLDPTRAERFERVNAALGAPDSAVARIVFFGDSRIEMWGGLPSVPGAAAVNRGCGGETTAQLLLRLERDVIALAPRVVVIQAGINDLKEIGLFRDRERPIAEGCMDRLDTLVARLRARDIEVVALTVFPVGRIPLARRTIWSDRTRAAVAAVNDHLRAIAGPGVTVVDCDPLLAKGDRLDPRYELDALHLNAAGYRALDGLLTPVLTRVVAEAAGGR